MTIRRPGKKALKYGYEDHEFKKKAYKTIGSAQMRFEILMAVNMYSVF